MLTVYRISTASESSHTVRYTVIIFDSPPIDSEASRMLYYLLSDTYIADWRKIRYASTGKLFPLDRAGWFGGDVIGDAVDAGHFVDDARRCFAQEFVAERVIICGHAVD